MNLRWALLTLIEVPVYASLEQSPLQIFQLRFSQLAHSEKQTITLFKLVAGRNLDES